MYPRSPPTAGKVLKFCQPGKDLPTNLNQLIQPLPQVLHVGGVDPTIFVSGFGILVQVVAAHLQKIGTPSLCLKKVIIAAAHIPQTPADGNANLAAVDALYPRDFQLLDTSNVVGVNTEGLCRSGMSQSHRQSCYQVQAGGHFFSFQQNIFRRSAVFQRVIFSQLYASRE